MNRVGIDSDPDLSPPVQQLLEDFARAVPVAPVRRELGVEVVVGGAFLVCAAVLALLAPWTPEASLLTAVLLALTFAGAKLVKFTAGVGYAVPTQLAFVPMLFLLPAGAVPLVVLAGAVIGALPDVIRRRNHPFSLVAVPGDCWYALGPAVVFAVAGQPEADWPGPCLILVVALAAQFALEFVATTGREWAAFRITPKLQPQLFGWVMLVDILLTPIGLLAALATSGDNYAFLLVLPLIALLHFFALEQRGRVENAVDLGRAYRGTTLLLADVLQVEDAYTAMHSRGVVSLAVEVANRMRLDERRLRKVEFAALLHDVGKIAIPKEVINKPGPLTDAEWIVVRTHTVEGQRMLEQVGGLLADIGDIVRSSHERWDGGGYPDGIAGDAIPLEARIVFCCDAFDAMTSDRPYRPALSIDHAVSELRGNAGTQFDPTVVDVLIEIVAPDPPARATSSSASSSARA